MDVLNIHASGGFEGELGNHGQAGICVIPKAETKQRLIHYSNTHSAMIPHDSPSTNRSESTATLTPTESHDDTLCRGVAI